MSVLKDEQCIKTINNVRTSCLNRSKKYALLSHISRFDSDLSSLLNDLVNSESETIKFCDELLKSSDIKATDMIKLGYMMSDSGKIEKNIGYLCEKVNV